MFKFLMLNSWLVLWFNLVYINIFWKITLSLHPGFICYTYTFHMGRKFWYTVAPVMLIRVNVWRSNNAAIFNSCFSHYTCRTCQGGDSQVWPAVSGRVGLFYNAWSLSHSLSSSLFSLKITVKVVIYVGG